MAREIAIWRSIASHAHERLSRYLASTPAGCDAVISALGHNLTLRGMNGEPRKLCTHTVSQLCRVA